MKNSGGGTFFLSFLSNYHSSLKFSNPINTCPCGKNIIVNKIHCTLIAKELKQTQGNRQAVKIKRND
jgi:hypothetical protein